MEGRRIFGELSVKENLELAGRAASPPERRRRIGEVFELFEVLAEKASESGASLSGGQQQMLAIGRALMLKPRLIVFDEISLGLAPIIVNRLYEALAQIRESGVSMLIIEQNVERGLALADRIYGLERGVITVMGTADEMRGNDTLRALYVGHAGATA